MKNKYNLGLISLCYIIVLILFVCLLQQYTNNFVRVLIVLTFIAFIVHLCICAYKNGKVEREFEKKEEFVHKKEIEEKFEKYKKSDSSK